MKSQISYVQSRSLCRTAIRYSCHARKHVLLLLVAFVMFAAPASAQNVLSKNAVFVLHEGTNTVFDADSPFFMIEVEMRQMNDSTRVAMITDPRVETIEAVYKLNRVVDARQGLACPEGFEAVFVADETRQYQMGYCVPGRGGLGSGLARREIPASAGRGAPGLKVPVWISYPEQW